MQILLEAFRQVDAALGVEALTAGIAPLSLSALLALGVALLASQPLLRGRKQQQGGEAATSNAEKGIAHGTRDGQSQKEDGCLVMFNADPAVPRGVELRSSPDEPLPTETDCAQGCFMAIHKPTDRPDLMKSGKYPYSGHMHKRKRTWEFRFQFTLKREIEGEVFIGLEMDDYPYLSWIADKTGMMIINSFQRLCSGLYFSKGDDPKTAKGEIERRQIVFPLWALDQYIETKEGDTPPELCDPQFPRKGMIKADDRRGFSQAIQHLRLKPGPTYTFGFWGPSQLIDAVGWNTSGKDLCSVGVSPPCYITMYALKPNPPGGTEKRHLDSRKDFIIHCAYWSNLKPPTARRAKELSAKAPSPVPASKKNGAAISQALAEKSKAQDKKRKTVCCF